MGETLHLYLAALKETIATVLVKSEDTLQFPVYYVSKWTHLQELCAQIDKPKDWIVYVDGSAARIGFRADALVIDPKGNKWQYGLSFRFQTLNNTAEYEALISRLQLACQLDARNLIIHTNSQLVVKRIHGESKVKQTTLKRYHTIVIQMLAGFDKAKSGSSKGMTTRAQMLYQRVDILKPFPITTAQKKFIIVVVDYFTKWIEVEIVATIIEKQVELFIWKLIVCRFGISRTIFIDNDTQFQGKLMKFYTNLQISLAQSSVKTLQTNGQVEAINKKILTALKKKVGELKRAWLEELLGIMWALQTTPHNVTGEMTFSFVYGAEVVIPTEIGIRSHRTQHFSEETKHEALRLNLDLVDELRETVEIKNTACA
ncbi:rve domain-containing protein [Gossypium australe]|uniref:Rve domain-containing protein n=1 Tax=Gossypium australe TaxID=47621 RepID=A0A5B6VP34_9ROSI|nr:rve domain-containing protein [Gossypium australe]